MQENETMNYEKMRTSTLFFKYVIPQIIGLVFNSIYFIVDGVFIGRRLGANALAAAGVAVPVVEIMIALSMLIAVGTGILISSANGRGDMKSARNIFNVSIVFTIVFSVIIAVAGALFTQPVARFLGAGDSIIVDTTTYLKYFLLFSPFLVLSFTLSTYARNDGRPKLAMWSLIIGSVSNIVLDYVFMYLLNMGMAGAALATGLGPVFSVIILFPHFLRKQGNLYFEKPHFSRKLLLQVGIGGLPAFITEFSIGFVTMLYNLALVRHGLAETGLAAYIVMGYAALICLTTFFGAGQGVQPVVSYFAGAGKWPRIHTLFKATMLFSILCAILFYVLLFFCGNFFYSIFINSGTTLLDFTANASRIYFINLPFAACNILMVSFLQSMERTRQAMAISLTRSTVPVFLLLLTLPPLLGQNGLWLAITCAEAVTLLLGVILWKRTWQTVPDTANFQTQSGAYD